PSRIFACFSGVPAAISASRRAGRVRPTMLVFPLAGSLRGMVSTSCVMGAVMGRSFHGALSQAIWLWGGYRRGPPKRKAPRKGAPSDMVSDLLAALPGVLHRGGEAAQAEGVDR